MAGALVRKREREVRGSVRGIIYTFDWSTCAPGSWDKDSSAIPNLFEGCPLVLIWRSSPAVQQAAHHVMSGKPPSRRDISLYITTPTLFQLNAAQRIKSGKPKEATQWKQNLTPSAKRRI